MDGASEAIFILATKLTEKLGLHFPSVTDRDMVLVSLPVFLCMSNPIIHNRTLYIVFYTDIFKKGAKGTPKLTFLPITFFL